MILRTVTITASLLALAGCSWLPNYTMNYRDTTETAPLKGDVAANDQYPIPELDSNPLFVERIDDDAVNVPRPKAMDSRPKSYVASLKEQSQSALNPRFDKDGAGTLILRLDGRFDRIWPRVTDAIAKTNYKMIDLDRSIGTYYFIIEDAEGNANSTTFGRWWRSLWLRDEETPENMYLLKMNNAVGGVYLSLQRSTDDLAMPELTEDLLQQIKQHL